MSVNKDLFLDPLQPFLNRPGTYISDPFHFIQLLDGGHHHPRKRFKAFNQIMDNRCWSRGILLKIRYPLGATTSSCRLLLDMIPQNADNMGGFQQFVCRQFVQPGQHFRRLTVRIGTVVPDHQMSLFFHMDHQFLQLHADQAAFGSQFVNIPLNFAFDAQTISIRWITIATSFRVTNSSNSSALRLVID